MLERPQQDRLALVRCKRTETPDDRRRRVPDGRPGRAFARCGGRVDAVRDDQEQRRRNSEIVPGMLGHGP